MVFAGGFCQEVGLVLVLASLGGYLMYRYPQHGVGVRLWITTSTSRRNQENHSVLDDDLRVLSFGSSDC